MYQVVLTPKAIADRELFSRNHDRKRVDLLLAELAEHPLTGGGDVERLKHYEEPVYSRRISIVHRMVYKVEEDIKKVTVYALYGHYDKVKRADR